MSGAAAGRWGAEMEPDTVFGVDDANTTHEGNKHMPIILWFLGVPLSLVILLMLFGVL